MGASLAGSLDMKVVTYGVSARDVDVTARIENADLDGSDLVLRGRSFEAKVHLSLLGVHNVSNALGAAAAAEAIGISPDAIRSGLEAISSVPGRLQRATPPGSAFCVFVDYAHTDAALSNVLQSLRSLTPGQLICVFGCGGDRDQGKRPRMASAVGASADIAYVTSDNPRTEDPRRIIDDILAGFDSSSACDVRVKPDRRRAIRAAIAEAALGDTVLIAGKGHETYQLIGDAVLPFDDVQVAGECLDVCAVTEDVS
jgi:UDP-N-acetylmuramoyl-L-alanyl-D-glutamate--2,6-diaminopimelate ligase